MNLFANLLDSNILTYILVAVGVLGASISLLLAIAENRESDTKFLGILPRDWKIYTAIGSFLSAILLIFLETQKDIIESTDQLKRYRYEDSLSNFHFDTTLKAINLTLGLQQKTINATKDILFKQLSELELQQRTLAANNKILSIQNEEISRLEKLMIEADAVTNSSVVISFEGSIQPTLYERIDWEVATSNNDCHSSSTAQFHITSSCLVKLLSKPLLGVHVLFTNHNLSSIKNAFYKDSARIKNVKSIYPMGDEVKLDSILPNLKPIISLETYLVTGGYLAGDSSTKKLDGSFDFSTRIVSNENSIVPFSQLTRTNAIIEVISALDGLKLHNFLLRNARLNKNLAFSSFSLLRKEEFNWEEFNQKLYKYSFSARISHRNRTD